MIYNPILMTYILVISWIIFITYWTVSAFFVKPAKEIKRSYSVPWLIAGRIFFILLFIISFKYNLLSIKISETIQWIGTIMTVAGLIIAIVARITIAGNWSGKIELKEKHELMTHGIYKHIRHPIYTGITLMTLGTMIYTARLSFLIFFLVMFIFLLFKIKEEEELLIKHFPDEYKEYRKGTKKLIPWVW